MSKINKWYKRGVIVPCRLGELIKKTDYNNGLTEAEIKFIEENKSFLVFKKNAKVILKQVVGYLSFKGRKKLINEAFGVEDNYDFNFLEMIEGIIQHSVDYEVYRLLLKKTSQIDFNGDEYIDVSFNLDWGFNINLVRKNEKEKRYRYAIKIKKCHNLMEGQFEDYYGCWDDE